MVAGNTNSTIRAMGWSFFEQAGVKLIVLFVQIVLARILTPADFGVLAIMLVIVEVADAIAQSGLGMALIQRSNVNDLVFSTAFWLSMGIALVLYLLLFTVAPCFASFYEMPGLTMYLRVLSVIVLINSANSIHRSFLQKKFDFKSLFIVNIIASFLSGVISIGAAYVGFGIWALVFNSLATSAFTCVGLSIAVPWKPTLTFNATTAGELFSYGWKVCATAILNVLYTGISELVIGKSCSSVDLGYYSQGRKWPHAAIMVASNSMQNVLFPALSTLKYDMQKFESALKKALKVGTFVVAPVAFFFAAAARPIVVLLLTDKWLPCVLVFQIICLSNSLLMLQLVNLRAYMALGDSGLYLKLQVIKVVLGSAIICSVAVLLKNIYWVAFATGLVGVIAVLVVDLHPAKRMHHYSRGEQLRDVCPIYLLSLIAGLSAWLLGFLPLPNFVLLVAQFVAFVLIYFIGARIVRSDELDDCVNLLKSVAR